MPQLSPSFSHVFETLSPFLSGSPCRHLSLLSCLWTSCALLLLLIPSHFPLIESTGVNSSRQSEGGRGRPADVRGQSSGSDLWLASKKPCRAACVCAWGPEGEAHLQWARFITRISAQNCYISGISTKRSGIKPNFSICFSITTHLLQTETKQKTEAEMLALCSLRPVAFHLPDKANRSVKVLEEE